MEQSNTWERENNAVLELTEHIDRRALQKIISGWNTPLIQQKIMSCDLENGHSLDDKYSTVKGMKTLYSKICKHINADGELKVKFSQVGRSKIGRMFAKDALSLQSMKKCVRHTISHMWYDDIDIVNCHPTLLCQYLTKKDFAGGQILKRYCENRDAIIEESLLDRESFKIGFLKILNGGAYKGDNEFMIEFVDEAVKIHEFIRITNPNLKPSRKDENELGSICNKLMCTLENKVLQGLFNWFMREGFSPECLVFDGLMIRKGKLLDSPVLKNASKYILETLGYSISLVIKPMDHVIDLSQLDADTTILLSTTDKFKFIEEHLVGSGDHDLHELYNQLYAHENIRCVDDKGKVIYVWDEDTKLWLKRGGVENMSVHVSRFLNDLCTELLVHWKEIKTPANDSLYQEKVLVLDKSRKKIKTIKVCNGIAKEIHKSNPISDFEQFVDSNEYLLPIDDGLVIDIRTLMTRDRTREDYFSQALKIKYLPGFNRTPEIDKFMLSIANGSEEERKALQILLGYSISGLNNEKIFQIHYGSGNNGKSTVADLVLSVMGPRASAVDHSVALDFGEQKRSNAPNSALFAVRKLHTGFINELDGEVKLKSHQIKAITSGGKDPITCRELYGSQATFIPRVKLALLCNTKPVFDGGDPAILSRLRFIPYLNSFQVTPENTKYVDSIKERRDEFFTYLVNGAHLYCNTRSLPMTDLSRQIHAETKETNDTLQQFIDERCVKNPLVSIRTSDFKDHYDRYAGKKVTATWIKERVTQKGFEFKSKKDAKYFMGIQYRQDHEGGPNY